MAKTWEDLKQYLGAGYDNEHDAFIEDCFDEAQALVDKYNVKWDALLGTYVASNAPTIMVEKAYIMVGAALFSMQQAPNGIVNQQFATSDGMNVTSLRIARDPMAPAYKILGRWVLPL